MQSSSPRRDQTSNATAANLRTKAEQGYEFITAGKRREDSGALLNSALQARSGSQAVSKNPNEVISAEATKQGSQAICIAVIRKAIKQPK
jgi:hypothetical protein